MEFINEGDPEELFQRLNSVVDDEVHYAGEVRIWFHFGNLLPARVVDLFLGHGWWTWQRQSHLSRSTHSCLWGLQTRDWRGTCTIT